MFLVETVLVETVLVETVLVESVLVEIVLVETVFVLPSCCWWHPLPRSHIYWAYVHLATCYSYPAADA